MIWALGARNSTGPETAAKEFPLMKPVKLDAKPPIPTRALSELMLKV